MLNCIAKILKRGKREKHNNGKKSPWSLPQAGFFKSQYDVGKAYDADIRKEILKKKMRKGYQGGLVKSC